jgi:hypothetical protein
MASTHWRTAIGAVIGATLSHAAVLYTFSNTGVSPYSFSFLEMTSLTTTGAFAIPPFQVGGLMFTQATLTQADGTNCFQFGTAGASLTATPFSCGLSAFSPDGGWQSLFPGGSAPGTYTAFNSVSDGSAPPAPNQLTIQYVSAFQYTFSNDGAHPYSFSFLESAILNTTGAFAIAPFQLDGVTFTQATLTQADGTGCFQFGTAGASLTATPFSCGLSAFSPDGGWQSLFLGTITPGTYTAFNAASDGSAPPAPDQLTITDLPEPTTPILFACGLSILTIANLRVRFAARGRSICLALFCLSVVMTSRAAATPLFTWSFVDPSGYVQPDASIPLDITITNTGSSVIQSVSGTGIDDTFTNSAYGFNFNGAHLARPSLTVAVGVFGNPSQKRLAPPAGGRDNWGWRRELGIENSRDLILRAFQCVFVS